MGKLRSFDESKHRRVSAGVPEGGQFAPSLATLDAAKRAAGLPYKDMANAIRMGGVSRSLDGKEPEKGFMVSTSKATEVKIPLDHFSEEDVANYVNEHLRGLMRDNYYFGGWVDNGFAVLDLSKNVFSVGLAVSYAIRAHQDSIYVVPPKGQEGSYIERQDYWRYVR